MSQEKCDLEIDRHDCSPWFLSKRIFGETTRARESVPAGRWRPISIILLRRRVGKLGRLKPALHPKRPSRTVRDGECQRNSMPGSPRSKTMSDCSEIYENTGDADRICRASDMS